MTERAHVVSSVAKASDTIRNFTATAKSRPLGEGGIAAGDDGRGIRGAHSKSSCLQKKYLSPQVKIASGGKKDYTIKKPAVYRPQGRM